MQENQRLFIAIFPPQSLRRSLYRLARQQHALLGGRCMRSANLHLTLAFLGNTPVAQIPTILRVLQKYPSPGCVLDLDILGTFRQGGILWAGSSAVPESLTLWVNRLRADLSENQIAFDPQAFRAHITLLRKATPRSSALTPKLVWNLGRPRLYLSTSENGKPIYQPIDDLTDMAN